MVKWLIEKRKIHNRESISRAPVARTQERKDTGAPVTGDRRLVTCDLKKGFTLIELMLAITILSVGMVGVLRAYSVSVSALEAGQESIEAVYLLKEKMAQVEKDASEEGGIPPGRWDGEFDNEFEEFTWELTVRPGPTRGLNESILTVSRKENSKRFSLVTYVENKQ